VSRNNDTLLEARGIWKSFGAVQALSDVNFAVYPHECVALVGDNGAGKSTLIKIMCGALYPNDGQLFLNGSEVRFASPRDARRAGISVVHQDLALFEELDVSSNVFLGNVPTRYFRVDRRRMARETRQVLAELAIDIPSVRTAVRFLSGGQRQAVAITRALHQGGRLMIMDEPTAALGVQEQGKVLQLIGSLTGRGFAVLVVSHNLEHVFSIADRIVVLRGGRVVGSREKAKTTHSEIVHMIVGAKSQVPTDRDELTDA
jgi:ABC-type sugar transport system ATPase subunit